MKEIRIDDDLFLAVLRGSDVDELTDVVQRNLPHIGPWMAWAVADYSEKQTREYLERSMAVEDPKAQGFGIIYKGKIAGSTGFVPRHEHGIAEIGYWIDHDLQGKGIVTKVTRALAGYAFRDLGVETVEIHTSALNLRSRAVAERLRFELIERREGAHTMPSGIIDDLVIYSIQKRNWNT